MMNICVTPHCNPSTKKRDTASRRIGVNERTDNRPTDRRTDGRPESTMPSPPYCCHRCQSWSRKSHLKRTPSMNVHRFLQLIFKHSYTYTRLHQILDGHVQLAPAYRTDQSTSNINKLLNCYSCTNELHSNTGISRSYHEAISLKKEVGYSCHLLGLRLNLHVPRSLKR